jgi:hypothetical protein
MRKVSIKKAAEEFEGLSEEERRALRISRFHAMPVLSSSSASSSQHSQPRLAHPGGPLATNKAVALGKFLKRKLSEPGGAASLDPALVEQAVNNAKATVEAGKGQLLKSGVKVLHVDSFSGSDKVLLILTQCPIYRCLMIDKRVCGLWSVQTSLH